MVWVPHPFCFSQKSRVASPEEMLTVVSFEPWATKTPTLAVQVERPPPASVPEAGAIALKTVAYVHTKVLVIMAPMLCPVLKMRFESMQ